MRHLIWTLLAAALLAAAGSRAAAPDEPADYKGMLEAHDTWRRPVGSPDLLWSHEAAQQAQAWADELARNECQVHHSSEEQRRGDFGENIYYYWSSRPYEGYRRDPATVVSSWGKEIEFYDEQNDECHAPAGRTCRHYTQVVWSRTTHVGCGRARCDAAEVWVCEYSPRGNIYPVRPYEPRGSSASGAESRELRPQQAAPAAPPP
ncbi:MAG TPA: CAP domain-containing protein [Nevskiaceae bacterium]|nr:CAP domain-containing protein [Nevskiaceae bacterium]